MTENKETNGWNKYELYVIKELEKLNEKCDKTYSELVELKQEVTGLKVKTSIIAGVIGFAAGCIIPGLLLLTNVLKFIKL